MLCTWNTIKYPDLGWEGEPSSLYEKWNKSNEAETWEDLYEALVRLSNAYVSLPPVPQD